MSTIIAGRFETQDQGEQALGALQKEGFASDGVSMFFVNPAGQHAIHPLGGDEDASPGSRGTDLGAVAGGGAGALVGAALAIAAAPVTVPVAGTAGLLAGAATGAYTGSLAGAMKETSDEVEDQGGEEYAGPVTDRHAGVCVAVRIDPDSETTRVRAVQALRDNHALEIEQAQGHIENGDWSDFDPREVVRLA